MHRHLKNIFDSTNHGSSWIYRRVCMGHAKFWYRHTIRIEIFQKQVVVKSWSIGESQRKFAKVLQFYLLSKMSKHNRKVYLIYYSNKIKQCKSSNRFYKLESTITHCCYNDIDNGRGIFLKFVHQMWFKKNYVMSLNMLFNNAVTYSLKKIMRYVPSSQEHSFTRNGL